jgi:Cyclin, N-terminal domain
LFFLQFEQEITNARGRNVANNANRNVAAVDKPPASRRSSGVTTRSMSHGSTANEETVAPVNPEPPSIQQRNELVLSQAPIGQRSGRLLANPTSYQVTGNVDNIDERDKDDPLCATTYVSDMYAHFREKELVTSVRPGFMVKQSHINERMRAILVDWLVEVHLKFKLVPETLYLTINLIDRHLNLKEVSRPKLQLVGVTCLLIASKYEEIYPPELRDLVYICDRAYSKNDVSVQLLLNLKMTTYYYNLNNEFFFLIFRLSKWKK